jgi:hypothetical protein
MGISRLFKKDASKKSFGTFQKIEEVKLNKIVGGAVVVSGDLHRPPTATTSTSSLTTH